MFQNQLITLFVAIAIGMALGRLRVLGLSLGSAGVLFSAMFFGHLGYSIPAGLGTFGLVLFVYCVGISAGSRFFNSIKRPGTALFKISLLVFVSATATAWGMCRIFNIPVDLGVGLFAGAMTSTPALAAALESLQPNNSAVSIGYTITYPFGIIGAVMMVQLLPRLLKRDIDCDAREAENQQPVEPVVLTTLVKVTNPNVFGRKISEVEHLLANRVQVSRICQGDRLIPLKFDDVFEENQRVLLVGEKQRMPLIIDFLGRKSEKRALMDADHERMRMVVTSKEFIGHSISELTPLKHYKVIVTRIMRNEITFVPDADTVLEDRDRLTVVGVPEDLKRFALVVGHRATAMYETDVLSLAVGIAVGIIIGLMPISLPGFKGFSLGMAGGPLLAGLVLGHFGRIGKIVGFIPRSSRNVMRELGLVLFLVDAGVKGGGAFVETVSQYGLSLFLIGAAITLIPIVIAFPVAYWGMRVNFLSALGGICGSMTSTPALGMLTSKTESQVPVVSYAAAYPAALILMILAAELLVRI